MPEDTIARKRAALLTDALNTISTTAGVIFVNERLGSLLADYPELWIQAVDAARVASYRPVGVFSLSDAKALMCPHKIIQPVYRAHEEGAAGLLCAECGWLLPPEWLEDRTESTGEGTS